MAEATMQPVRSRRLLGVTPATAFDAVVVITGCLLAAHNLARWVSSGAELRSPVLLLAPALVVLLSWSPLMLPRRAGDIVIGFDSCALVYLTLVLPAQQTLVIWAAGVAIAHGIGRKSVQTKLFNIGLTNLTGTLAVVVIGMLRPAQRTTVGELLAVAAGCCAYFLADVVITAFSLWLMGEESLGAALSGAGLLLPLVSFVGVDSLGYLAALVTRALPAWTLLLLGVPIGTILVASRAVTRLRVNERRLSGLFQAAAGAQKHTSHEELERSLLVQAGAILAHSEITLRTQPPGAGEIGAPVNADRESPRWVVARRNGTRAPYDEDDQRALDTLTGLAVESMARMRLVNEMAHLARYDTLTGLPNRALLHDRIAHAMNRRLRTSTEVALLYCDLDGFKAVNDRVGHHVGDLLLSAVAERMRGCVRPSDTAARLGGDEFAVLLEDVVHRQDTLDVAQRIVEVMRTPYVVADETFHVGVSVGIAYASDAADGDELLRNADMAMYRAKALGKNRVEAFEHEMRIRSLQRIELEDDLRAAVHDGQIAVHYQPVVDLVTGEVVALEALARWRHPRLGVISPETFVQMSEQMGLIRELGAHVLDRAHREVAGLCARLGRPLRLSVNVSARQLADEGLVPHVRRLRASCPQLPLVVELTESVLIDDDDSTLAALRQLKEAGVALAIDDFGVGYSSVGYLRRLPADILKIDRSFTEATASDPRTRSLTAAILAMAGALQLTVIAEGIEQPLHAAVLRSLGCPYGQGFLFAQPMPLDAVAEFLARGPVPVPDLPVVPLLRAGA
ncbi:MAG: putative bifunctional diguanylate cyclase/phosphodiesterase [Frankiaceae bacterium]